MPENQPSPPKPVLVPRDERGRILPGHSLHPGGRVKGLEKRVRELVDFDKIIVHLQHIALGTLPPGNYGEVTVKVRDSVEASKLLFDRGHGKARAVIDLTTDITAKGLGGVDAESLDDHALQALRDTIQRTLDPRQRVIDARVAKAKQVVSEVVAKSEPKSSPPDAITIEPEVSSPPVEITNDPPVSSPREVIRHVFKGSANVAAAVLDVESGIVEVAFTSGVKYRFANFTRELIEQWGLAVSAGRWFNVNVAKQSTKHPPVRS